MTISSGDVAQGYSTPRFNSQHMPPPPQKQAIASIMHLYSDMEELFQINVVEQMNFQEKKLILNLTRDFPYIISLCYENYARRSLFSLSLIKP